MPTLPQMSAEQRKRPLADRVAELAASDALVFVTRDAGPDAKQWQREDADMASGWQIDRSIDFDEFAHLTAVLVSVDSDGLFGDKLTLAIERERAAMSMGLAA